MLAISAVDTTIWSTAWQFRTLVDVGITEPALNRNNVSVFPNPSLDGKINISINSTSAQQIDVSVVNMVGQEVVSGKFGLKQGSNLIPLQLGNNETGIFFINIRNNASAYTTKIVVNQ